MAPHSTDFSDWQVNYPEIKMRSAHLWRSRDWADCTFRVESPGDLEDGAQSVDATVDAHKLILAMASPVFAAMFYGNVGDKEGPVHISDIDLQIFKKMMDYIYTDEVDITSAEVAINLFRAANKYILVHLEKRCIKYLFDHLNTNNVCHVYEFSCLYNEDELKQKCLEMFSTKTCDVLKGCGFNNAQVETLRVIYSMDSLNIDSELDLFRALILYTEAQPQEVIKEINVVKDEQNGTDHEMKDLNTTDCSSEEDKAVAKKRKRVAAAIEQIRFLTMTPQDFAQCKDLRRVLSDPEILALSMNISSAKTDIPMPAGFSISRMPRHKNEQPAARGRKRGTKATLNSLKKKRKNEWTVQSEEQPAAARSRKRNTKATLNNSKKKRKSWNDWKNESEGEGEWEVYDEGENEEGHLDEEGSDDEKNGSDGNKSDSSHSDIPKHFRSGNFLLLKSDVKWNGDTVTSKLDEINLFKIDGKALLQKFIPMESNGKILHKCTCVGKRNSSTWTERIVLKNISKLKEYQSPIFCVDNIPWMVQLTSTLKTNNKQQIEKRLLVDIICMLDLELTWSLNTLLGVRMIPSNINVRNMTETTRSAVTVVSNENDGTQTSFSWKMVTDPAYGVVRNDDSLIMEVYIAQEKLGISKLQKQAKREDEPDFN